MTRFRLYCTVEWCNSTVEAGPEEATESAVVELEQTLMRVSWSAASVRQLESSCCKPTNNSAKDAGAVESREVAAVANGRPVRRNRPSSWPSTA